MTSISDTSRSKADWRSIDIGRAIHREVVAEGQREGVWAYLYHDGKGNAWFEKRKKAVFRDGVLVEKCGVPYRRFSRELAEKMRRHKDDLRVYARWCEDWDQKRCSSVGGSVIARREIAAARCAALVDGQVANRVTNTVANNPPPRG